MTTVAAIDSVVRHSLILEMMRMASYRAKQASDQHASANGVTSGGAVADNSEPSQ